MIQTNPQCSLNTTSAQGKENSRTMQVIISGILGFRLYHIHTQNQNLTAIQIIKSHKMPKFTEPSW